MRQYYLAPLEGITGHLYRSAYHRYFEPLDKYFTPFIKPNQKGHFSTREKQDLLPENNRGMTVVPQLLTNCAEDFIITAQQLAQMGYQEINLNLGCPSKTVINKARGAGFLAWPDRLREFLDEIFDKTTIGISLKTRIGKESADEFPGLLDLFNQYPLTELIVHPRLQRDFYRGQPNHEAFALAAAKSRSRLCYNGDVCSAADNQLIVDRYPAVPAIMIGRGILRNPGLIGQIKDGQGLDREILRSFHDDLYQAYQQELSGDRNILFKMKELWLYLGTLFADADKCLKKIRKAEKLWAYEEAVDKIFADKAFNWEKEDEAGAGFSISG